MAWQHISDKRYDSVSVMKMSLNCTIGSFVFGYTMAEFTSCQDSVSATLNWDDNESILITIFSAIVPLGAIFGAVISCSISRRFGRRKMLMLSDIIGIIGCYISIIPTNYTFGIGRFITGFVAGSFAAVCPIYLNEIAPTDISGRVGILVQYNITLGIAVAYAMALPLPTGDYNSDSMNYWWMFVFALPSVFMLIQLLVLFYVYRRDTPRWLIKNKKRDAAFRSLKLIYSETFATEYLNNIQFDKEQELLSQEEACKSLEEVVTKSSGSSKPNLGYGRRLRLGIMIQTLQQWCGVNVIVFYVTGIFEYLGTGILMARVMTLIVGIVNNLGMLMIVPLIDRFGRKPLCLVGEGGMVVGLVVIGLITGPLEYSGNTVSLVVILTYISFFTISLGPIAWVYCGEILDEKGNSITTAVNWVNAFLVVLLFPFLKEILDISYVFYLYAGICLLGFIYLLLDMKETKGLTREQINSSFRSSA